MIDGDFGSLAMPARTLPGLNIRLSLVKADGGSTAVTGSSDRQAAQASEFHGIIQAIQLQGFLQKLA